MIVKKYGIALSVWGVLASGAMAQNSVTVYGLLDADVRSLQDTLSNGNGGRNAKTSRQLEVGPAALNGNRLGFKGTENLGQGISANFQLEQGFTLDDGAQQVTNTLFNRHAWVGLSGQRWGEVRLGRTWSVYDVFRGGVNNAANTNFNVTNDTWKAAGGDYTANFANHFQYLSPVVAGWELDLSYALGENKNAVGNENSGATNTTALALSYTQGPWLLGYSRQSEGQPKNARDTTYQLLGGSYDWGSAKLVAAYNQVRDKDGKERELQLGLSAPLGAFTAYVGYAKAQADNTAGVTRTDAQGVSLLGTYALSKRTTVYGGWKRVTDDNGPASTLAVAEGKKTQVSVGVRHTF